MIFQIESIKADTHSYEKRCIFFLRIPLLLFSDFRLFKAALNAISHNFFFMSCRRVCSSSA